jgi:branched-chain amino acid aminotransferase
MSRLAMPEFDGEELVKCIKELLKADESWIPSKEGYSMYVYMLCKGLPD